MKELNPEHRSLPTACPEGDSERADWIRLSMRSLEDAYGENEPEYSLDMIKRPNPEYEGR
jgi:hypothetical protein